jgi:hypothetical protein
MSTKITIEPAPIPGSRAESSLETEQSKNLRSIIGTVIVVTIRRARCSHVWIVPRDRLAGASGHGGRCRGDRGRGDVHLSEVLERARKIRYGRGR